MTERGFSELTPDEVWLDTFGTFSEQQKYIVGVLVERFPDISSGKLFKPVGAAIKAYSFSSVVMAAQTIPSLIDARVYPMLVFAVKSYHTVELSSKTVEQEAAQVKSAAKGASALERSLKKQKMLANIEGALMELCVDDVITKEQFKEFSADREKATEFITEYCKGV